MVDPEPTPPTTEELWNDFAERLGAWFRRRAPQGTEPDELLQECFLRIHAGLPALRDTERVAAWVFQIARSVLVDALRRRPAEDEDAPPPEELVADEPGPEVEREVASWLEGFARSLGETDRAVLRLHDFEGRPLRQVAASEGLTLTAAKSRAQRARGRLRDALLACCRLQWGARGELRGWEKRGDDCGGCD